MHRNLTQEIVMEIRDKLENKYSPWERKTIGRRFDEFVEKYGDRYYLLTKDHDYTYKEIQKKANLVAKAFIKLGIKRREHIAVVMPNCPELFYLMLGIPKIGCIGVLLNDHLRKQELEYVVRQSDSVCLIVIDRRREIDYVEDIRQLCPEVLEGKKSNIFPKLRHNIVFSEEKKQYNGFMTFDELLDLGRQVSDDELEVRQKESEYPDEPAYLMYTSGTTAEPKGALLTHDGVWRSSYGLAHQQVFEDKIRIASSLPDYHIFALACIVYPVMFLGGSVVTQTNYNPDEMLGLIEEKKANAFYGVPLMVMGLLDSSKLKDFRSQDFFHVLAAASAAPAWMWEKIKKPASEGGLGVTRVGTGYGGTEQMGSPISSPPLCMIRDVVHTIGTVSEPCAAGLPEYGGRIIEYKLVDPSTGEEIKVEEGSRKYVDPATGRELPVNVDGLLAIRGPVVTVGFYKKPVETAEVKDHDGWMSFGDVVRIDEEGRFSFTGRTKEMYKMAGENVATAEVEQAIGQLFPKEIKQAFVTGVPDERVGEAGLAFIMLNPGESLTKEQVIKKCKENMASFKVPKYVFEIKLDDLPTTTTGKIQKFRLTEMGKKLLEK